MQSMGQGDQDPSPGLTHLANSSATGDLVVHSMEGTN